MVGVVPPLPSPVAPKRYAPLVLHVVIHDLPSKYLAIIKTFGSEEEITIKEHVDEFNDFIDKEEVDHEDVKTILFAQIFNGEVRKWFKVLALASL